MSIFHHLIERVWDGYLTLKHHLEKYPDNDAAKADKNYRENYTQTIRKIKEIGRELEQKRELINDEVKTIGQNIEGLAVLKEKMSALSEMMEKFSDSFEMSGGGSLESHGEGYLKTMAGRIHEFNDLLNTSHNLLAAINKKHRLLQKEERKLEK